MEDKNNYKYYSCFALDTTLIVKASRPSISHYSDKHPYRIVVQSFIKAIKIISSLVAMQT